MERPYAQLRHDKLVELPPLLLSLHLAEKNIDEAMEIVMSDPEVLPPDAREVPYSPQAYDLAVNLTEQYQRAVFLWSWGDAIYEWINNCRDRFEYDPELRTLLPPAIWPNANNFIFAELLAEKDVLVSKDQIERALGSRLYYRHLPQLASFSLMSLIMLHDHVAQDNYRIWASHSSLSALLLPPDNFVVQIFRTDAFEDVDL